MKKIAAIFLLLMFVPLTLKAELDPKVKAVAVTSVYGAVGGALLGTAAIAFNAKPRAIFQGASLGLYAGILFGSYIVFSHVAKQQGWTGEYYADPAPSPYEGEYAPDQGEYDNSGDDSAYYKPKAVWEKEKNEIRLAIPFLNVNF